MARVLAEQFCLGTGLLTTSKKFPGGLPGGCLCLELIDALVRSNFSMTSYNKGHFSCTDKESFSKIPSDFKSKLSLSKI